MSSENLTAEEAAKEKKIMEFLANAGVEVTLTRHKALFTVEDSSAETGHMPGAHTKNLFLKNKSGDLTLVSCLGDRRIRIADLEKAIGQRRMSFASPELLGEILGVTPGSVTPFALINDQERKVRMILDAGMMAMEPLNFHPLHNRATLTVSREGFLTFLKAAGYEPQEIDFDALEARAAAREAEKTG